jgi:hypothetical protein
MERESFENEQARISVEIWFSNCGKMFFLKILSSQKREGASGVSFDSS